MEMKEDCTEKLNKSSFEYLQECFMFSFRVCINIKYPRKKRKKNIIIIT